jgi:hypothetical protein
MGIKNMRARISRWLNDYGFSSTSYGEPQVDEYGLLTEEPPEAKPAAKPQVQNLRNTNSTVLVKPVQPMSKTESIEKLQEGFNKLIGQLENINTHLRGQIEQQQMLMGRMEKLPDLLESLPSMAENQKKLTDELVGQLKTAVVNNEQFMEVLEKIPNETAKQTDCLMDIDHQLTAAANVDVQMAERFNRFNIVLDKMNETSAAQSDSIMQMSRTFAASDRYMKYLVQRQNTRFTWIFVATASVCGIAVLILAGIVIYLRH